MGGKRVDTGRTEGAGDIEVRTERENGRWKAKKKEAGKKQVCVCEGFPGSNGRTAVERGRKI